MVQRVGKIKTSSWTAILLFLPPMYGLWLLSRAGQVHKAAGLYRFFAQLGIWLPLLAMLGILTIGVVGAKSTDQLVELLIAFPWLPVLLTALFSLGISIPAAVCGWLLFKADEPAKVGSRWRKFWRSAGYIAWPTGAWKAGGHSGNR